MSSPRTKDLFRLEALDQLSSPEQLDQLLQVVSRKSWIPLATLAMIIALALLWSLLGRIPVTVEGAGLLVYPHQVVPFQSPAAGQIVALNVKAGDPIRKRQVLGRLNQPDLQQRLDQERVRLEELEARHEQLLPLRRRRLELERGWIEKNRLRLTHRIESNRRQAELEKHQSDQYFQQQDESLGRINEVTHTLGEAVRDRYDHFRKLMAEGNATEGEVLDARRDLIENNVNLVDLELRIHQIELHRIEAESTYIEKTALVAEYESQVQELEVELQKFEQLFLEFQFDSRLGVQEAQRRIARYEEELLTKAQIVSEFDGRVLEITGSVGQFVGEGQRLGAVEIADPAAELRAAIYFDVTDGKKVEPGMDARISPTTVQRARHGSIVGSVLSVSPFAVSTDAVTNVVGNAEVARRLTADGDKIEVFATLARDAATRSGFRWTSGGGPPIAITAGTTVTVRATVESRPPISYLIPALKRWSRI